MKITRSIAAIAVVSTLSATSAHAADATAQAGKSPLTFASYLGLELDDDAVDVALDAAGNAYILGNLLLRSSAPGTFGKQRDAFLIKLSRNAEVLYFARIGGTYDETARGLAVDPAGIAYVTGSTSSVDFPITANAYQATPRKTPSAFLCAVDTTAPVESSLVYSTYFPADIGNAVALDRAGNVYVTGEASWGFVTTRGAFQPTCPTCPWSRDAFVSKFDIRRQGAASLIYSTYLGGGTIPVASAGIDSGLSIAVDSVGQAVVVGEAGTSDFPTRNALDPAYNGGASDAFVAKLNAAGSGLVFSTFLGSQGVDSAQSVALDRAGNIYVAGFTGWYDFPATAGAWQTNWNANQCGSSGFNRPCPDAFVARLSPAGALVYATYLGGPFPDYAFDIAVDDAGNAIVAGHTISPTFPRVKALEGVSSGANDAFVTKLNAAGTGILFSSLIGGGLTDTGKAIAISPAEVVLVGTTLATDFPVTENGQTQNAGGEDAFVVRFPLPDAPAGTALKDVSVLPASVTVGAAATAVVTLDRPAPAQGAVVLLSSSHPDAATVPPSITVPPGAPSVSVPIATKAAADVTISASFAGVTMTARLAVVAPRSVAGSW